MKQISLLLALLVVFSFSTSCTTATYGKPFVQTGTNEYTFKIYTGGFAFKGTATERAQEEIKKFMEQNDYKSYKIISSHYELFPLSGTVFKVEFSK